MPTTKASGRTYWGELPLRRSADAPPSGEKEAPLLPQSGTVPPKKEQREALCLVVVIRGKNPEHLQRFRILLQSFPFKTGSSLAMQGAWHPSRDAPSLLELDDPFLNPELGLSPLVTADTKGKAGGRYPSKSESWIFFQRLPLSITGAYFCQYRITVSPSLKRVSSAVGVARAREYVCAVVFERRVLNKRRSA